MQVPGQGLPGKIDQILLVLFCQLSLRFSPDGTKLAYASIHGDLLMPYCVSVAGRHPNPEALFVADENRVPHSWTPDSKTLLFGGKSDIWSLVLGDPEPQPLLDTPASERAPAVSPDGKWLAFLGTLDGTMFVVSAKGEWEMLASVDLGDEIWATPAIDDGKLIVRTRSKLYSFGK